MKQHITVEQLNELDKRIHGPSEKLYQWAYKYFLGKEPLLTIGQIIEFLSEKGEFKIMQSNNSSIIIRNKKTYSKTNEYNTALCDILWEVVKEVLDNH